MDKAAIDARFRVVILIWTTLLGGVTLYTLAVAGLTTGVLGDWTASLEVSLAAKLMALPALSMTAGIVFRRGELRREGDAAARMTAYQNQVIIGSALQEGGGLLGLSLALLASQPTWALGVWALTAVAMGLTRPSRDEVDRLLR